MPDVTRNMFYWFRGPSPGGTPAAQRQLENNLTKSLITVLEHCDRSVVLRAFLQKLGLSVARDVVFSLQRKPAIATATRKRIVLAITGGDADPEPKPSRTEEGRPDAWICSGGWTILIESKIGARVTKGQLAAHARAAGWPPRTYRIVRLSWQELHRFLKNAFPRVPHRDEVSRLLLTEWLSYLEYQNMAEFEKLEPVDFDFFNLSEEERRALLPHMKARMRAFAGLLAGTPAARKMARLYSERAVDDWKFGEPSAASRGSWFNIGGAPSPNTWHVTVFFQADGLDVTLINSYTHLTRKLCRSGEEGLRTVLELASRGRDLAVSCRRAWYRDPTGAYKGQKISRTDDPLVLKPAALGRKSRDVSVAVLEATFEKLLASKKWRTELKVFRDIGRSTLLSLSAKRQVALVAKPIEDLYPILKYLLSR